ncbi:Methyltransferase domain-containing protein [Nitrosospira briensis]|uniref:Methyltransferase domain-containing protein n=1 Tax=Nitrosospira briensis TaxID=35799 RepID=A0A1I5BRQ1_9PROT|nr:class I SAM-dependent methyltransferase [Nitrosospira briensis]SFN77386.1 Methyltransferase domain-containing protein [Nitrosospira briensis]
MSNELDWHAHAYGAGFDYAFDNNIISNWYPDRIMALSRESGSLLELGIGRGVTTEAFSRHFVRHVVVDGSPVVINRFREQFPQCTAEVLESYFEKLDIEERFDAIVMGFVLEHVYEPVALLKHIRRFLKPGGRLFVAVPNGESLHRRIGHAAGLLLDMTALGKGDLELGHHRSYSVTTLDADLTAAGWMITRREGIFLKPLMTHQLISLQLGSDIIRGMCEVGIGYPELSCALLFEAVAAKEVA